MLPRIMPTTPMLLDLPRARLDHARHAVKRAKREWMLRAMQPLTPIPRIRRMASRKAIEFYANSTVPRPYPFSMLADYTSWHSLTDRRFSGRHLPPSEPRTPLPPADKIVALFARRPDAEILSTDTTATFSFFAQWFTDSFLRTDPRDPRMNTSNHGIDLCQIYGLTPEKTATLREPAGGRRRGRLRSQIIEGQEYPEFLFANVDGDGTMTLRPEFEGLHDPVMLNAVLASASVEQRRLTFAVGLENGNSTIGHTMFNVVFMREHNRIADILAREHPDWEDTRVFETTRNIMIVVFLKLVIEEYIKHIGPRDFPIELVPYAAENAEWNRQNWITIEFNLLYRWHSMVPDHIGEGANALAHTDFVNNNRIVLDQGIEQLITMSSADLAGKICLHNTPEFLMDPMPGVPEGVMAKTIRIMRDARLASYNDYRTTFNLPRLRNFDELTDDVALRTELEQLYGDIDNLEWYVGLFAEKHRDAMMMGELMGIMVGHDAFTQALTNPLLAPHIFNEKTLTRTGLEIYRTTTKLEQIFERNTADPAEVVVKFRWDPPEP